MLSKRPGRGGWRQRVAGTGRLFAAVETLYEVFRIRLGYVDQTQHDRKVAAVAWAEGRQWTLEQAIKKAQAVGKFSKGRKQLSAALSGTKA